MTAKDIIDRLENDYRFECEGGPLKNCVEWQGLRRRVLASLPPVEQGEQPGDKALAIERAIARDELAAECARSARALARVDTMLSQLSALQAQLAEAQQRIQQLEQAGLSRPEGTR